jgi:hypothetical protein
MVLHEASVCEMPVVWLSVRFVLGKLLLGLASTVISWFRVPAGLITIFFCLTALGVVQLLIGSAFIAIKL